ncbi:hypothetical protein Tco_0216219 [Tanacetum coccineum]
MKTEEVSDRFVALCFVNGLEAYDEGNKVVKKELIVALRGEIYFVKFIINPEEDDVEPGVIFGRSFLRMTKAITDFGVRTVTIYPEIDPLVKKDSALHMQNGRNKVELDGKNCKRRRGSSKKIKGEALKEKDDPGAFIFPIRLEKSTESNENRISRYWDRIIKLLSINESITPQGEKI